MNTIDKISYYSNNKSKKMNISPNSNNRDEINQKIKENA